MTAISWKSPVGGDWNVAANWSTDTVPTFSDDVTISALGSVTGYTVTISSDDQAHSLSDGELGVGGGTLVENAGSLSIAGQLIVEFESVTLNEANPIESVWDSGQVNFGNPAALGSGTVTMVDGMLLATTNESLTNALSVGDGSIAAAAETTLDINGSATISDSSFLGIGLSGEDGTVLWHGNSTEEGANVTVQVGAGTLKAADGELSNLLGSDAQTTVEAGATIDLAGFSTAIFHLTGGGEVIDSGAAATLNLSGANFSGTISGPLSLIFDDDATLSGLEDYTGSATVASGFSVTNGNGGTYDLVANTNVNGTSTSNFINNNLFEKTGGGGVSDVTSNFVNSGTLNVLSGSIAFSGGFSNTGVIHGLVTRARVGILGRPPEATVSAAVPSDFNGDSRSDILWQNVSGQASVWEMNGNSLIGGGPVSANPGASWRAVA